MRCRPGLIHQVRHAEIIGVPYLSSNGEVRWLESDWSPDTTLCRLILPSLSVQKTKLEDFYLALYARGSVVGSPHLVGSDRSRYVYDLRSCTVVHLDTIPVIAKTDYNVYAERTGVLATTARGEHDTIIASLSVPCGSENVDFLFELRGSFVDAAKDDGALACVYCFGNMAGCLFLYQPGRYIYILRAQDLLAKWNTAFESTCLPRDLCKLVAEYTGDVPVSSSPNASAPVITQMPAGEGGESLCKRFALAETEVHYRRVYINAVRDARMASTVTDDELYHERSKNKLRELRREIKELERVVASEKDHIKGIRSWRLQRLKRAQDCLNNEIPKMKRSLEEAYDDAGLERDTSTRPPDEPVAKRTRATKERSLICA